jgi:hypothetical protein
MDTLYQTHQAISKINAFREFIEQLPSGSPLFIGTSQIKVLKELGDLKHNTLQHQLKLMANHARSQEAGRTQAWVRQDG